MKNYEPREIPKDIQEYWENFLIKTELNNHQTLIVINDLQKYTSRFQEDHKHYMSMSRLGISDWVGPIIGFLEEKLVITEGLKTEREKYLKELDNRVKWIFKLSYAQCYEEFERFWKNCLHFYLSSETPKGYEQLYINKNISRQNLRATDETFTQGLKLINRSLYLDCNDKFNIKQVFTALALARHKIIHNFGEISKNEVDNNIWLEKFFSIDKENKVWRIDMPKIQYSHALKKLSELGFMFRNFFKYYKTEH